MTNTHGGMVLSQIVLVFGVAALAGGLASYVERSYGANSLSDIASTTASFEARLTTLEEALTVAASTNASLAEALEDAQKRNKTIERNLEDIEDVVDDLEKLSETDKELLQKYSKVYFLNEHYVPSDLSKIDSDDLNNPARTSTIHSDVKPFLEDMLEEIREDGLDLRIVSAYRSFDEQSTLKAGYKVTYGSGANQFSADQGFSEHQLGTTVDLTTPQLGDNYTAFGQTEAYQWMLKNAWRYGFVLSYPENNAYYQFEPWHWRFVGEDLARQLDRSGRGFYDLDQREIDEYLIDIFD